MSLLRSAPLLWFDDQPPEFQFAAYTLLAVELGDPIEDLPPEVHSARRSESVRAWLKDLDERFRPLDRESTLSHLRALMRAVDAEWKVDFQRLGFLPRETGLLHSRTEEGVNEEDSPGTDSPVAASTKRLLSAGLVSEATAIVTATYLLMEEGFQEVTTSQVTALLKEAKFTPSNASSTIQDLARPKRKGNRAPDLEIVGKTNRGKRPEWLFRLTASARHETGEKLRINAGEAAL